MPIPPSADPHSLLHPLFFYSIFPFWKAHHTQERHIRQTICQRNLIQRPSHQTLYHTNCFGYFEGSDMKVAFPFLAPTFQPGINLVQQIIGQQTLLMQPNSDARSAKKSQNPQQTPPVHQWAPYPYPYPYYPPQYGYPLPVHPQYQHQHQHQHNYPQPYPVSQYPSQNPYPMPPHHYPQPSPCRPQNDYTSQRNPPRQQPNKGQSYERQPQRQRAQRRDQKPRERESEYASDSCSHSSEDEEQLYVKTKTIKKKRDPVMDSPAEIKKWVEARKKNYPGANQKNKGDAKAMEAERSILETRIRKKIMLVSSDGRGIFKKIKNMDILRRLISENKIDKVGRKRNPSRMPPDPKATIAQRVIQRIRQQQRHSEQAHQDPPCQQMKPQQGASDDQSVVERPVQREGEQDMGARRESGVGKREGGRGKQGYRPEEMIKHLKERQDEDRQFYGQLLDYKSNSLNYRYNSQTLDINFLLEDIFEESSYLLQAIRHIVKNDFYERAHSATP